MGSGSQRRFVDWEEKFVSHDRGSRVVHYYLKDRHGHQFLAVIGTERSLRHMVYVVCDDFLPLVGLDKFTTSAFKWRARREVVDWLSAFLTKTRSPEAALSAGSPYGLHSSTDADSSFSHEGADGLESGQEECRSGHYDNEPRKQCFISKGDVVWVGSSWSCRKRLRHFNSFLRNGITISVQNFVYVMTEEKDRHIAFVEDLFEDKKLRKKLRVRWFHKTSELDCRIPPPAPHIREVFFTTFQQDLSVECVDGVATVLSPEHLEACLATLPADSTAQALMCYREFDGEVIRTVSIEDVKGYWRQPILSVAGLAVSRVDSPPYDQGSEDFEMDEEEAADPTRLIRRGPRTARCSRRRTGLGSKVISRSPGDGAGDRGAGMAGEAGGSRSCDPHGSGERTRGGSMSRDPPGSGESNQSTSYDADLSRYDVGHHIEVLSEDSGLRGKWFKATVLERHSSGLIKVSYDDLFSCENGEGNVEEWKSTCKVARSCKLGIRISGRPCIRPYPLEPTSEVRFHEGEIVDAWWDDGWWEGILRGKGSDGLLHVFIPGERETAVVESNKVRVSKEWVNGTWTAIPSCPDVVMLLGLSIGKRNMEQEVTARETRQCRASSRDLEVGQTLIEERCQSPVKRLNIANVEAVEQSHTGHDFNSTKEFGVAVKEESRMSIKGEQDEQMVSSLSAPPRSPRSGGAVTPGRLVFRQSQQDPQADGISFGLNQNHVMPSNIISKGITASWGIPLKWRAGRKRHRQGDLMSLRVERIAAHSVTEMKDFSTAAVKHEVSSDGDESVPVDDAENLHPWKNGNGEEVFKHKKQRKGNDSSLKALHGTPMGSSLFSGPLPIANLVMSR